MSNYLTTDGLKKTPVLPEAPLRPEASGICHICHMVNPALLYRIHTWTLLTIPAKWLVWNLSCVFMWQTAVYDASTLLREAMRIWSGAWNLHFRRYIGNIFEVWWIGSKSCAKFRHDSAYQKLFQSSAGLTMWQMWQMPRASGLKGASGSREIFFSPSVVK